MTLRFLSSTVNAFSEKLVMETFHENKFMWQWKYIFNNFIKGG